MNETIAIVDDEPDIRELVALHLAKNRFVVKEFADGGSFLRFVKTSVPDLVVLDLMLPDMDGFEICKYMKSRNHLVRVPIVMLTAKGEERDTLLGLELGADDYVKKPFSPRELVARIKSVLRRVASPGSKSPRIEMDGISIDGERYEVLVDDKKIDLTATEFRILQHLASHRGRVFGREAILDALWGNEKTVTDRTIDVHIKHLRSKLGAAGRLIKVVRGAGYKVEE
jgi:DNA-binding response OmpR family regulator